MGCGTTEGLFGSMAGLWVVWPSWGQLLDGLFLVEVAQNLSPLLSGCLQNILPWFPMYWSLCSNFTLSDSQVQEVSLPDILSMAEGFYNSWWLINPASFPSSLCSRRAGWHVLANEPWQKVICITSGLKYGRDSMWLSSSVFSFQNYCYDFKQPHLWIETWKEDVLRNSSIKLKISPSMLIYWDLGAWSSLQQRLSWQMWLGNQKHLPLSWTLC
jgi:hypothetical protein